MYKSVISILALMSFASCAMDHEIVSSEQERKPIALTSVTKAANGETPTTPFNSGDVWLWANTSGGTEYIKAWQLNANNGSLSSTSGEKYWPNDGSSLTFYALHGNFKNTTISEGSTSWADLTSLTHTVESNQSTETARNTSDLLLYAKNESVESNTTPVKLTFDHLLAKITVKLDMTNSQGIESADLYDATISVTNISPDAVFDSSIGTAASGSGNKTTITVGKIATTTLTDVTEIGSAIVPPQSFGNNENANIIQITLSDGRIFSYSPTTINLEKGLEYTFTLKIIYSEISVSSITVKTFTENSESMSWDDYVENQYEEEEEY